MSITKKNILKRIFQSIDIIMPILVLITMIPIVFITLYGAKNTNYVDKEKIHVNLTTAITNGALLSDVKQIFKNRPHVARPLSRVIGLLMQKSKGENKEIYREPINLLTVLKDIKSELYLNKSVDSNLIELVSKTISDHEKTNPFDKLESGQKIHFEIVQTKLGENYASIQANINRIVDEIDSKNQLVNKYFNDATLSFRISIFAILLGFIAIIPQIVLLWKNWKKKISQD